MKFKKVGAAAFCGALATFVSITAPRASTLVDQGQNTYDPNTNLLWLDLTITANHSYNDVVANFIGTGNPYAGYRFATSSDVATLFADAGVARVQQTAHPTQPCCH